MKSDHLSQSGRPAILHFLDRFSLTSKMLLLLVVAGVVAGVVLDGVQSRKLRNILYAQQTERLDREAREARVRFDNYVSGYNQTARILVSHTAFRDYLAQRPWARTGAPAVRRYDESPPWLPDASVLRRLVHVHYALLLDENGVVREIYQDDPDPLPKDLLHSNQHLRRLSDGQSYMTKIGGLPFVLTSESVSVSSSGRTVTLMLASPLEDDFLTESQGGATHQNLIALVSRDRNIILSSGKPDVLPAGTRLEEAQDRFIITGKSFFDGSADLMLEFTSLISKDEYDKLSRSILGLDRTQRACTVFVLIVVFAAVMYWITRRIKLLTKEVANFSRDALLGAAASEVSGKDALYVLRERFRRLSGEVVTSWNSFLREKALLEETNAKLERAYAELKAAQSQLLQQEKMASVGQLAAGVAHEINNPMGFIISNLGALDKYCARFREFIEAQSGALNAPGDAARLAELAEMRKRLKIDYIIEDANQLLRESREGAERVKNIVQNLKGFSRVDEAEYKPADINAGLESTLAIVWNELKYKATVTKDYGALPLTRCNIGQLNQVFMNLLVNAAQAIEKQGTIAVKTWTNDGSVFVSVADTGCGIPGELCQRIFEPFFTTKDVGQGTGLGLSISYDIVKKHNGDMSVSSEPGKGTTFTVRIPVV